MFRRSEGSVLKMQLMPCTGRLFGPHTLMTSEWPSTASDGELAEASTTVMVPASVDCLHLEEGSCLLM